MSGTKWFVRGVAALALVAGVAAPVGATTLVRAGLDELVADNATIVVADVLDAESYWNTDGTFILTDVRVAVNEVVKGTVTQRELTLTTMGGTVGDLTTLIVAGAELIPGRSYLLFLNDEDLPGAPGARTVRDLVQGVFELVPSEGGLQAVSQANSHPLLADIHGFTEPPGGKRGLPLDSMVESIHQIAGGKRQARPEVK